MDWLKGRLAAHGVETVGPSPNGADWRLTVNAEAGGVTIRLGRDTSAGGRCTLVVEKYGDADLEYEDALAACEDALAPATSAPESADLPSDLVV